MQKHRSWTPAAPDTTSPAVDWRQQGVCRTEDPEAMFPHPGDEVGIEYAKDVCAVCPVRATCLEYALTNRIEFGVWGGLTEEERRDLRKPPVDVNCGTDAGYRAHKKQRTEVCEPCQAVHDQAVEADRRRRLEVEHEKGGSASGMGLHIRLGEPICGLCREANRKDCAARRAAQRQARLAQADPGRACLDAAGTPRGYQRHIRAEEEACGPCEEARRTYKREVSRRSRAGLTEPTVRKIPVSQHPEIVRRSEEDGVRPEVLAAEFGVTKKWIRQIVRRARVAA